MPQPGLLKRRLSMAVELYGAIWTVVPILFYVSFLSLNIFILTLLLAVYFDVTEKGKLT